MPQPVEADLSGKICIVTGANTGIGKETAKNLARMKAHVVMACRSPERGQAALEEIKSDALSPNVELMLVDLSSQDSIRKFAAAFREKFDRLDVLVNNAGVWMQERKESADGLELTFGTNVLGYFLLTNELLDLLEASAPARIVNVASGLAGKLDMNDLQWKTRKYSGVDSYSSTKQANRMLSWELADRLGEGSKVTVNALHPGAVSTEIARDGKGIIGAIMRGYFKLFGRTVARGADTVVWLAASPEAEGKTGEFWFDRKSRYRKFYDKPALEALWAKCEELTASKVAPGADNPDS